MPRWRLCELSCSLLRGSPASWRRAAEARNVMHRAMLGYQSLAEVLRIQEMADANARPAPYDSRRSRRSSRRFSGARLRVQRSCFR